MSGDDELARTATAAATPPGPVSELGATLGRYRLERQLGAGGMGVVHAAFDPDLERRVALKVLRSAASGDEARQRLLREARAMARLQHPHVVVVHEVGTAGGRDYVAMELIDGTTVDEWLRAAPRAPAEILAVFVAAGRGLAAAHAAGLVHRDFKPHNVLRARDGRVVVTDFGLARGTDAVADPLAVTARPTAGPALDATPGSLTGLTQTGSVLGTPAYMAPEQWRGEVGPASDQFAYCVALWEALVGQRPFRAESAGEQRALVERGLSRGDLGRAPRWLRPVVARGLAPDPARRFPSMDALLAALPAAPAGRRVGPAIAAAVGIAATGVVVLALAPSDAPRAALPPACPAPALDPASVWSPAVAARVTAAGQGAAVAPLAADVTRWTEARGAACAAGDAGAARRACLDGVLGRLDAVARGAAALHADTSADVGRWLIDPAVCAQPTPPKLAPPSAELAAVIVAALAQSTTRGVPPVADARALVARTTTDPCARALAAALTADLETTLAARTALSEQATADLARCDDDRVRAEVAVAQARTLVEGALVTADLRPKLQVAEATVARVRQPDLVAELELLRAGVALTKEDLDTAIAQQGAAAQHYAERGRLAAQLVTEGARLQLRALVGGAADLAGLRDAVVALRARAVAAFGPGDLVVQGFDRSLALEDFHRDVPLADIHRALAAVAVPAPQDAPRRITGQVRDERGAPVAGARVIVGPSLTGDSASAAFAFPPAGQMRETTTDATGAFAFDDAPATGVVVAEAGARRGWATEIADRVALTIGPTGRIRGHVDLHGAAARNAYVGARGATRQYQIAARVEPDGTFEIAGVPYGDVVVAATAEHGATRISAAAHTRVAGPSVDGIAIDLPSSRRAVPIVVQSTVSGGPGNAEVVVVPGRAPAHLTVAALSRTYQIQSVHLAQAIEGEHAPAPVLARARRGDLFSVLPEVGAGAMSACAIALPAEVSDPELQRKVFLHRDQIAFQCVPIPPDADVVTVAVPPFPRLD